MRILHTSDWHLGRSFHRVGLLAAQAAWVDHVVEVVRSERVDVVVVAGDVYDRALPGVDVVALLDEALARLVALRACVVMTSGNHDSAARLGFGSRLMAAAGVQVRTDPARVGEPVLLADRHGEVAVYPLPYLEPSLTAAGLDCERRHAAVLGAATAAARADLAGRAASTRSVVVAHAFVTGGTTCDSERDIAVGGTATVPSGVFDGFDYTALGHLHGRQAVAPAVRYSGSPLAFSFSEARQDKGGWLVELEASGLGTVTSVPAPVPRGLAVLSGDVQTVLTDPALAVHEESWCQVTLTDPVRPADAMARVRARFPHTVQLLFAPRTASGAAVRTYAEQLAGRDDAAVCAGFVEHVRGRGPDAAERVVLASALEQVRRLDPEEAGAATDRLAARAAHDARTPDAMAAGRTASDGVEHPFETDGEDSPADAGEQVGAVR